MDFGIAVKICKGAYVFHPDLGHAMVVQDLGTSAVIKLLISTWLVAQFSYRDFRLYIGPWLYSKKIGTILWIYMPIELKFLRYALALAEHKNFVRAANACEISQPSLSRDIQEIERRVGTQLFERAQGGVVPTPAGRIFLERAREMVTRSAELSHEMDLLRGLKKSELRIGAGTYPAAVMVNQTVIRLVQDHPQIRLLIRVDNREDLLPLLKKRELDVAVIVLDELGEEPDLHLTRMGRHQGYFVVRSGHPLVSSGRALSLQNILHFPVAMTSRPSTGILKRLLHGAFQNNRELPPVAKSFPAIACDSVAMMKSIIACTDAVALLPLTPVIDEVAARTLTVLPLVLPGLQADFGVAWLAQRPLSRSAEIFIRMLQEEDAKVLDRELTAASKLLRAPASTRSKKKAKS